MYVYMRFTDVTVNSLRKKTINLFVSAFNLNQYSLSVIAEH